MICVQRHEREERCHGGRQRFEHRLALEGAGAATILALDTLRRRQPIGFTQLFGDHDGDSADEANPNDALPALIDPADMEQSLAARDLVNQLLLQVTPRQRAAVLLWAKHGLTMAEIAEALETTEVNVRQLLSRGRARFRALYDREIQGM